jgi:hypothetical protein
MYQVNCIIQYILQNSPIPQQFQCVSTCSSIPYMIMTKFGLAVSVIFLMFPLLTQTDVLLRGQAVGWLWID